MITYKISPGSVKTFAAPDKPFLAFNEFVNIVQWYRDVHWAPDNVPGFDQDIGKTYNVWTRHSVSTYHRHIFPDELAEPISISFEVLGLEKNASFPVRICLFDEYGMYFEHEQELVMERMVGGRFVLTGWKKVPNVREFVLAQGKQANTKSMGIGMRQSSAG